MWKFPALSIALLAMGLAGCPLTIEVREDGCVDGPCTARSDAGGPPEDAGDSGTTASTDAGCAADRQLDQPCQHTCQCATPGAQCQGSCVLSCESDFECPAGRRCQDAYCVKGPRLGEFCMDSFDCGTFAMCDPTFEWCFEQCANDFGCPNGYRCSPDQFCIPRCEGTPSKLGQTCENSMNCDCGFCVDDDNGMLRCHQRCLLDSDCPGGAPGSCEMRGNYRVCRL